MNWSIGVASLIAFVMVVPVHAQETPPPKPLFTWQDGLLGAGFVGATLAARPVDKYFALRIQRPRAQENRIFQKAAWGFNTIATGTVVIGPVMYAVGRLAKDRKVAALGLHGTEALLIGEAIGTVIKGAAGRERPWVNAADPNPFNYQFLRGFHGGEAYRSFPSGHTLAAFAAAAAVTSETAGWWPGYRWAIGTTMYGGATMVGLARMYNNRHWASDVIMGAAIGTFAGTKVVRYHNSHPDNRIDRWLLNFSVTESEDGGRALYMSILPSLGGGRRFSGARPSR
jgi:membrane-associated phospholipid phosphatase